MERVKTNNRSVRHTKKRIKDGFIALLQEKPIQKCTVKELTDAIDLSRGAFYTHYSDLYELLEEMENELLLHLNDVLAQSFANPKAILSTIFLFLEENTAFCKILICDHTDINFMTKLKESMSLQLSKSWNDNDPLNKELLNNYLINGLIGILEVYLDNIGTESCKIIEEKAFIFITETVQTSIRMRR